MRSRPRAGRLPARHLARRRPEVGDLAPLRRYDPDDLEFLAELAGDGDQLPVRRDHPDHTWFIGKGKVDELKDICLAVDADTVVFDNELSPAQQYNLEKLLGRTALEDRAHRLAHMVPMKRVGSAEEIANAINDNTAMIYTTDLGEKLEQELKIAKDRKIPMLLDDAAGIPPVDNAKLYARMGIDMYCFSGGKGLRGPQCSGLLLGRKDLIEAALLNSSPREGAVCRPMKVGKEEVIGCLTALETWLKVDEKKLYEEWNARIDRIRKLVETVPGVTTSTFVPEDGNRYPTLRVKWDQQAWGYSIADCVRELRASDPIIEVLGADNPSLVTAVREGIPNRKARKEPDHIELVSMTIKPGEEIIVGQRLRAVLGAAQKKAA